MPPARRGPAVRLAALAVVPVMAACGGGDGERPSDDAGTSQRGTPTATGSPEKIPDGELVRCESPEGFVLGRPASWSTNSGTDELAC